MRNKTFERVLYENKHRVMMTIIFIVIYIYGAIKYTSSVENICVFDYLSGINGDSGIASRIMIMWVLVPLTSIIVTSYLKNEEISTRIINSKKRANIFNKHTFFVVTLMSILTLITLIIGYFLSGSILGTFENKWRFEDGLLFQNLRNKAGFYSSFIKLSDIQILLIIFISKLLCFICLGMFILFLSTFIRNKIAVISLSISIVSIDVVFLKTKLFIYKMFIFAENWTDTTSILINQLYVLMLIAAFYYFGRAFYQEKDFI